VALEPPRVPYGAFGRMPDGIARILGRRQARRLRRTLKDVRAVVVFHPLQAYLAEGLLSAFPDAELWYARWDRYEAAQDAGPGLRRRLEALHAEVASASSFTFAVSGELVRLEREAGRAAELVVPAHDEFPAPDPARMVFACSLGHLGYRTDWALLRALAERMDDLVLMLVGQRHDEEVKDDPDFAACLERPNVVWLGRQPDEAAARIVAACSVGIVPFALEPFNDAGLPQRIVKYARMGRRTLAPDLAGVRTLDRAVTVCTSIEDWERELRAARPDPALRDWALEQEARVQNEPLWDRLEALGVVEFA
jgi:hypothetical protein